MATAIDRKLHQLNETGSHVLTVAPDGKTPYWCPVEAWVIYEPKGFTLATDDAASTPETVAEPRLTDFDPSQHGVDAVNRYLAEQDAAGNQPEVDRVLAAEAAGQKRKTVQAPAAGDPA